ncbi:FAS1 domain-containing protein [Podospora conica]|nr:FAS1 domain-containing protein [Schizothecium conicum]
MFHLSSSLLALVSLLSLRPTGVNAVSLEDVFRNRTSSSTFRWLIRTHPEVFHNISSDRANGVTILAPNNQAFDRAGTAWSGLGEARVRPTLQYHILKRAIHTDSIIRGQHLATRTRLDLNVTGGQPVFLTKGPSGDVVFTSGFATRATVLQENIPFDDGYVHIIDSVLRMPESFEATTKHAYTEMSAFLGALHATGLINEINAAKDITIFAPHNDAFHQLYPVFENMTRRELKRVMRYHIVPGTVLHSWEFTNGTSLTTSDKNTIAITRHDHSIYANSAHFLQTDILISNGVVQMIDNCLSPNASKARPDLSLPKQRPVLSLDAYSPPGSPPPPSFPCAGGDCSDTEDEAAPTETPSIHTEAEKDAAVPSYGGISNVGLGLGLMIGAIIAL